MKKKLKFLLLIGALASALALPISASPLEIDGDYAMIIDGFPYEGDVYHVRDRAYVALREFACMADNSVVSWLPEENSAHVLTDSLELRARDGGDYIEANGRLLWCEEGLFTYEGVMYVPLRQIAKAFGFATYYSESNHTTYLTRQSSAILPAEDYYNAGDLYWLAKIIEAEAGGEPFLGKLAVGNVILNRVDSEEFPSSVYDVIFDRKNGVQFTPTIDGAIEKKAGADSVAAAKICLEDYRLSDTILYFLNESISTSKWVVQNCTYVMTIGNHDFYME